MRKFCIEDIPCMSFCESTDEYESADDDFNWLSFMAQHFNSC